MSQEKLEGNQEPTAVPEDILEKAHLIWAVWGLDGGWRKVGRVAGTQGCRP